MLREGSPCLGGALRILNVHSSLPFGSQIAKRLKLGIKISRIKISITMVDIIEFCKTVLKNEKKGWKGFSTETRSGGSRLSRQFIIF